MPQRPPRGFHARRQVQRQEQHSFDWDRAAEREDAGAAGDGRPSLRSRPVGEIARQIKRNLSSDPTLNNVWIEGEVRSFSRSGAGHYYFDLADADSETVLSCAFFRRENRGMAVAQGDQVLVHGSVDIYLARGTLQIIVDDLRPIGEGVLQAEYERLFRTLEEAGLFNPARKRPLPAYPKRIGVVTSSSGAVWHDIQQVIGRRWPLTPLTLSPCLTQGAGAARSIADGIERLNLLTENEPDVIIVARGGGSPEDLWAYNEEAVARAIFASDIPIISAIGHETDVSIADHVADRRAPTPSAAAEIAVPDRAEEAARVAGIRQAADHCVDRLIADEGYRVRLGREGLERAAPHPPTLRVEISQRRRDLDQAIDRLIGAMQARSAANVLRLNALDPERTLQRGYAVVSNAAGSIVTSTAGLAADQDIHIQFADGGIAARTIAEPTREGDHA